MKLFVLKPRIIANLRASVSDYPADFDSHSGLQSKKSWDQSYEEQQL